MAAPASSSSSSSTSGSSQTMLAGHHPVKIVLQGGGHETNTEDWEARLRAELGCDELRLVCITRCCDKCPAKGPNIALCGFQCNHCNIQWDSCIGLHEATERICVRCGSSDRTVYVDARPPVRKAAVGDEPPPPPYSTSIGASVSHCFHSEATTAATATLYMYHGSNNVVHIGQLLQCIQQLKDQKQLTSDPVMVYEEIAEDSSAAYKPPIRTWWKITSSEGQILAQGPSC